MRMKDDGWVMMVGWWWMSDNDADVVKLFFQGSPENTTSGVNDFLRERGAKRDPAEARRLTRLHFKGCLLVYST